MLKRSHLSLEKDRFNFACNLAYELGAHLEQFGSDYPEDIFNGISKLQMRCYNRCLVTNNDLQEGAFLLGTEKFKRLSLLAMMKGKLETDLVN
jgi:hypothetical protein